MSIEQFFGDPRRRRSEELAFFAERAERTGDPSTALLRYAEAAALEEANALDVPGEVPRVRSVLAISAVALWLRAERWDEAARAGCTFLAAPEMLTPDTRRELESLVDRAWRSREVESVFGRAGAFAGLEARLLGGSVRAGVAPAALIAERREVLVPGLYRVAEWRAQKKFRRAGVSSFAASLEVLEAPARAASFGLRLFIGQLGQQVTAGEPNHPGEIIASFLELASAAAEGTLERVAGNADYARAFARAFRDLAGDGSLVGSVELTQVGARRPGRELVSLGSEQRTALTAALTQRDIASPFRLEGVLKSVNLRGSVPTIAVELANRTAPRLRIAKGEHDDTIGPKLNRSVRVIGRHEVSEDGEAEDWADDVVLLEDTGDERASG